MLTRSGVTRGVACIVAIAAASATTYGQYDPPANYYATATGTGTTLKNQLHNIIDNHFVRSYGDARQALQLLDEDPDDSNRIILIYNGASVIDDWDSGVTWNREHQWPRSLGVDDSGPDNSDLFQLRPCEPSVNSNRGNKPFGSGSSSYWDPIALAPTGVNDRGDCARSMFYMATRYDGSDAGTVDLELVDGFPGANQMGDRTEMLEWHYSDPVNVIERRRNHLVYSIADNPSYYQGNRNPFIDRPEFVWAIWGPAPNDSTLYVSSTVPQNGTSTVDIELRLITGSTVTTQSVTLRKTGANPTTYDVTPSGDFTTPAAGRGQAFVGGTQAGTLELALVGGSLVPGLRAGTVVIDNTDLTSAGTGAGFADGDDTINLTAEVVARSEASFHDLSNQDSLAIDFGMVDVDTGSHELDFTIHNLESASGFTADLDIDSVSCAGDTAAITTDLAPLTGLSAGAGRLFTATLDSADAGVFEVTCTVGVSDENIDGAAPGTPLTLTLTGEVAGLPIPAASTWGLVVFAVLLLIAARIVAPDRRHD